MTTSQLFPDSLDQVPEMLDILGSFATTLAHLKDAWEHDPKWWKQEPELVRLYESQLQLIFEQVPKGYQQISCFKCGIQIFTDYRPRKNVKIFCPFGCRHQALLERNRLAQRRYRNSGNRRRAEQRKKLREQQEAVVRLDGSQLDPPSNGNRDLSHSQEYLPTPSFSSSSHSKLSS